MVKPTMPVVFKCLIFLQEKIDHDLTCCSPMYNRQRQQKQRFLAGKWHDTPDQVLELIVNAHLSTIHTAGLLYIQ